MQKMNIEECYIIQPNIFTDHRGSFSEIYKKSQIDFETKQVNYSYSKAGTLRGLHRAPYAKLVTCLKGRVFDVCLDLRDNSPTYMQYSYATLDGENLQQLYIPAYCAHGFYAYENSIILYLQDSEYIKDKDETYCYKSYNIPWPDNPQFISEKDQDICQ